jgi:hypothetical protein
MAAFKEEIKALEAKLSERNVMIKARDAQIKQLTKTVQRKAATAENHKVNKKNLKAKPRITKEDMSSLPVIWVLKSAKPGQAWIAEKGSSDMRIITVGDSIDGIGSVISVGQGDDGKWVVVGRNGRISQ